jgi:urease accessory protein
MKLALALLFGAILVTSPAEAHFLGAATDTAFAGFLHPFSGVDHVLAMVAIGLWAAQQQRTAATTFLIAFPAVMAIGSLLGASGSPLPAVEIGIISSVVVLGLMIMLATRPPLAASTVLVSLFALFHGHVHGTELPDTAASSGYFLGFVVATVILHVVGLGLGRIGRLPYGLRAMRVAGSAIAVAGVLLLAQ